MTAGTGTYQKSGKKERKEFVHIMIFKEKARLLDAPNLNRKVSLNTSWS